MPRVCAGGLNPTMCLLQVGDLTLCRRACCNSQAYDFVDQGSSSRGQVYNLAPLRRLALAVCIVWQHELVSCRALHPPRLAPCIRLASRLDLGMEPLRDITSSNAGDISCLGCPTLLILNQHCQLVQSHVKLHGLKRSSLQPFQLFDIHLSYQNASVNPCSDSHRHRLFTLGQR
jgi:hypothetical protein